ncbi:MAG: CBS domain-containing protein [Desulfotomaculales bacterium]
MKTVREIMVPLETYPRIPENSDIREAVKALRAFFQNSGREWQGFHLLVVCNGEGKPVGLLTMRCLLMAVGMRALARDAWLKAETWSWYYLNRLNEEGKLKVREVMRPIGSIAIDAGESVSKAASLFAAYGVNSLPVSEKGKIVGILRTIDVFREINNLFFSRAQGNGLPRVSN